MNIFLLNSVELLEKILLSDSISMYLITIIAGLFGFIIASIPLTIQLLELKGNDNINKINKNPIMKKKIFERYIKLIKASFYLFIFILYVELLKIITFSETIIIPENIIVLIVFIFYLFFIYKFLCNLYKLINVLKLLISIYLNTEKEVDLFSLNMSELKNMAIDKDIFFSNNIKKNDLISLIKKSKRVI